MRLCDLCVPSPYFLIRVTFGVARNVAGITEIIRGQVSRLSSDPRRDLLTPEPYRVGFETYLKTKGRMRELKEGWKGLSFGGEEGRETSFRE